MIDAGESEGDIAAVIKAYKPQGTEVPAPSPYKMEVPGTVDEFTGEPKTQTPGLDAAARALEPLAHPKSGADFLSLAIPNTPKIALKSLPAVGPAVEAVGRGVEKLGSVTSKTIPYSILGTILSGNPLGLGAAVAPSMARGAGRMIQRAGKFMGREEPLLSLGDKAPVTSEALKEMPLYRHVEEMGSTLESSPTSRRLAAVTKPAQKPRLSAAEMASHPASRTPNPPPNRVTPTSRPTPFHSTEPADWHSGAEPGSIEAQQAQSLHRYEREMDAGYKRHLYDELLERLRQGR